MSYIFHYEETNILMLNTSIILELCYFNGDTRVNMFLIMLFGLEVHYFSSMLYDFCICYFCQCFYTTNLTDMSIDSE